MTSKNSGKMIGFLLACILCFSLVIPETGFTSGQPSGTSIEQSVKLDKTGDIQNTLSHTGESYWYQFTPDKADITTNTHLRLTLHSNLPVEITVYPSKEKADKGETFYKYQAYADKGQSAEVDFPYAWNGAYYIQITGVADEEQPNSGSKAIDYQLHYESVNLPPAVEAEEECAVELSAGQKKNGAEIMKHIRMARDGVLNKTENGKKLVGLYYKTSPFLVAKMTFNKKAKDSVYNNLVQLRNVFQEIAKNGVNSSYKLTDKDQQAIQALYDFTVKHVPRDIKNDLNGIVKMKDLKQLRGKTIKQALSDVGLYKDKTNTNKLIIKLKGNKSPSWLSRKIKDQGYTPKSVSALAAKNVSLPGVFVANVDRQAANALIKKLDKMQDVEYVERLQTYRALTKDVQYPYQWSLSNTGQEGGKHKADVKYTALQKLLHEQKLKKIRIAVADTGVDSSLADLQGKVRADLGKNFIAKNNDANDDEGHGTHVSGIIAASAGNGYSMAGLNQTAEILPVKVLDAFGEGDTEQIALGIKYAADQGAKVINLSLGGYYSRTIEYALKYAASKNVTIIAAAGNNGMDELDYPASSQYTIAVGATNKLDITADYSSYGEGLALVAPGSDIPSLLPNGNVTYMSGTSMAAPHVTAVAGMMLAKNPKLTSAKIKSLLTKTADDIAVKETDNNMQECYNDDYDPVPCVQKPGYDYISGWGRLNALGAVSAVDLKLKPDTLKDNMITLTGSAKEETSITVKKGKQILGRATADKKGNFKVKLSKVQRANTVLRVAGTDEDKLANASMKLIVKKGINPPAPKVKTVSNKSTAVTGKTLSDLKVTVKNKSKKVIASGKANSKGNFKLKIKKQKAGTVLYVTVTDLAKRQSKAVKVKVKDKIPPKAPKVSKVTNRDTAIKGKTESSATIMIKKSSKQIASKKADHKGRFKLKIKKQKAGTVLYVTAKDKAGNISKATKVTVKKKK